MFLFLHKGNSHAPMAGQDKNSGYDNFTKFVFSFFKSMESYVTNKTVLVVDDEIDFCHMIRSVLSKQGFKVILAHTLEFAITQLATHNPTIILLDHNMPDGLGTRFLENNKSALKNRHVIFITGDDSPAIKDEAIKLGVFDFLPKPFHYSALNKVMYLAATFN